MVAPAENEVGLPFQVLDLGEDNKNNVLTPNPQTCVSCHGVL